MRDSGVMREWWVFSRRIGARLGKGGTLTWSFWTRDRGDRSSKTDKEPDRDTPDVSPLGPWRACGREPGYVLKHLGVPEGAKDDDAALSRYAKEQVAAE